MLTIAISAITSQKPLRVLEPGVEWAAFLRQLKAGTAMVKCGAASQITLSCAREGGQHTVGWRMLTMPVC